MNANPRRLPLPRPLAFPVGLIATLILASASTSPAATSPSPPGFDFTLPGAARGWHPAHGISRIEGTREGLVIEISGDDPYTSGPALDLPGDTKLWLRMRMKATQPGMCQVFFWNRRLSISEANSVRFAVPTTGWVEKRVPVPALGPKTHFRIDPPGTTGRAVIAFMKFEPRVVYPEPTWPKPAPPTLTGGAVAVRSGDLVLRHGKASPGDFVVEVAGEPMATGLTPSLIGYVQDGRPRWMPAGRTLRDADGATWHMVWTFAPGRQTGAVDASVKVTVDRPRDVVFLPMFFLVPGAGSFGKEKGQGLFAGLEYLANEPSSSEADIRGPESKRQVPDSLKITFPLMAIQAKDRYVGLVWAPDARFAAIYDSPDRLFGTGGHVMGLIFPGSDKENRPEGSLMPYGSARLEAGEPLVLKATVIGGKGKSVIPAVGQYVALRGLPPVPDTGLDTGGYVRLAAAGWLDSKIREGDLYRHAFWPNFGPQPAADVAVWMNHLALRAKDAALAERLRKAATTALARVNPQNYYHSGVSHVRYPVAPLVYGHVAEAVERARGSARGALRRFEPDGRILYRQAKGKPDFGSTHFAPDSNGQTGRVVKEILEAAVFCGDPDLIKEGLGVLRSLDTFQNTVPRGAQTWEVPLHTPDVLASAHMLRAYTLGYEITGEKHFLDQARYWAWTGVPFVYLVNPTAGKVGPYSTIAVYGATNWRAPVWFGRPVQWCGLVYADALYRFAAHDPDGSWRRLADGITAAGIQHSWKQNDKDRQGLLPDFYHLRAQRPDGPAINPGTVQANATRMYDGMVVVYDLHVFRRHGLYVHAPGPVAEERVPEDRVVFVVEGSFSGPYYVLVSGLKKPPKVRINGAEAPLTEPHQYLPTGNLILKVKGVPRIEIVP